MTTVCFIFPYVEKVILNFPIIEILIFTVPVPVGYRTVPYRKKNLRLFVQIFTFQYSTKAQIDRPI